jgi:hypothetical protein
MVARLLLDSVNLAQKPKSAENTAVSLERFFYVMSKQLTDLDIANSVEQDIVTFDITMDNILAV